MHDRRQTLFLTLMPSVAMLFLLVGGVVGWFLAGGRSLARPDDLVKVRHALDRVEERFYGGVAREKLLDGALEGIVSKLDPYCEYLSVQDYKEFEDTVVFGRFGGVGIVVGADSTSGYLTVETPVEDSPAFEADILPGDQVREVDGKSIKGIALTEVVKRIKGEPGTKVTLTIARKGRDPFRVTLTRQIIHMKAVRTKMLDGAIGYVRISDFTKMMDLFDKEIAKLQEQGLKGLIIDLRFNGGGLLEECVKLADRFLDDGIIVTTRGNTKDDQKSFEAHRGDTLPPWPLVVLVNEGTASASEIFSGAMKDRGRGKLVGSRTFGKGSVQTPFPLGDGSYLKLTTARYFTPNGTSVHREEGKKEYGLEPDFRVDMSQEEYAGLMKKWNADRVLKGEPAKTEEKFVDAQLEAGIEVVRAALENREPKVAARVLKKDAKPQEN